MPQIIPPRPAFPGRSTALAAHVLAAVLLAWLPGCGSDVEPAATADAATIDASTPFADIPREQLYGATPAENLWSPRLELEAPGIPPGWDGARFAIISDFHLGQWSGNEEVAAAAIQKAADSGADVTLLLGDYVEGADQLGALDRLLAGLQGKPVVAVLGDRDIQTDSLEAQVTRVLQGRGVTVLRNASTPVAIRGDTAWIAGIDPDIVTETLPEQQYLVATLAPAGRTPILLTHLPALATRAPTGRYPVIIGGDTFCGSLNLPGSSRLASLAANVFPGGRVEGVDRLFRVQSGTLAITCGIGFGYVPIRFGAAPEVPILTLTRPGGSPESSSTELPPDSLLERLQQQAPTQALPAAPPGAP